ncbi:MAG: hypothetical protein IKN57_08475, partial [Parasporobacterium sp.]|nr:hypothetical protein [Parasporobacterium sp.]
MKKNRITAIISAILSFSLAVSPVSAAEKAAPYETVPAVSAAAGGDVIPETGDHESAAINEEDIFPEDAYTQIVPETSGAVTDPFTGGQDGMQNAQSFSEDAGQTIHEGEDGAEAGTDAAQIMETASETAEGEPETITEETRKPIRVKMFSKRTFPNFKRMAFTVSGPFLFR